jgi:hypothetical protein
MKFGIKTVLAALAVAGLFTGCGDSSGGGDGGSKGDYTLNLTSFTPHNGENIMLKVKSSDGATTLGEADADIASGTATLTVPGVLEEGKTYRVDFFADTDGDGIYDEPTSSTDFPNHSWRRTVTGKSAGVTESFPHDADWTDISPF